MSKNKININSKYSDKFKKVYKEYYLLHPDGHNLPKSKLYYLHRQWFFPNHIDLVLKNIDRFHSEYYPDSNKETALFAGLLHDSGLVYKRTESSPKGHEKRSCEYARMILTKHKIDKNLIEEICKAIDATDSSIIPNSKEALLVRNADAYSQLNSLHFFAKAYFSNEFDQFVKWFEEKVESSYKKITISELIKEVRPLLEKYRLMIKKYHSYKNVLDNILD